MDEVQEKRRVWTCGGAGSGRRGSSATCIFLRDERIVAVRDKVSASGMKLRCWVNLGTRQAASLRITIATPKLQ